MLGYRGPAQPSPTLGDALNAGYLYLEVRCLGCDTHQTVALDIVRRPKTTPIHELERYMRCRDCSGSRLSLQAQPSGRAADDEDISERSAISMVVGGEMMSLRDIVAGVLIGPANQTWFEVLVSSVGWGFVAWLLVVFVMGRASYKPDSPALTRFIIWWTIWPAGRHSRVRTKPLASYMTNRFHSCGSLSNRGRG